MDCPRCSGPTNAVEGRVEPWCNRCLAFVGPARAADPTAEPPAAAALPTTSPPAAPATASREDLEPPAAAAALTSLLFVLPILAVTAIACTALALLGFTEAALITGLAGAALAYLFR